MRRALFLLCLVGLAFGCTSLDTGTGDPGGSGVCVAGKCDTGNAPRFEADLDLLNDNFRGDRRMETIEDAFRVRVTLGDQTIVAGTHLFGDTVNVIPYGNEDGIEDGAGNRVARGDSVLAQYFEPGEIGIAVKHHRPSHRELVFDPNANESAMKENFKLQDSHIELVVGVNREGAPGVVTLNNPQSYEGGRFGDESYPMIFLRPSYPSYLGEAERVAFRDNIRTMMVGFNAVSHFPGDYNGGDPLAARNPDQIRTHVTQMVKAIAGDRDARDWFQRDENQIYCAELAFVSYSSGLIVPLNAATMVPLVGQETWDKFTAELAKHNRGESSTFTQLNSNRFARYVELAVAPETLTTASSYAPADIAASEAAKLAFRPMTMSDIVEQFLRTHVPRQQLGEALAPIQGALLAQMKPALFEAMGMERMPETDPRRQGASMLFDAIVGVVGTPYADYAAFRAAVEPLLAQARMATGPRGDTGEGLFAPPSLMHVVAQGSHPGGLIGLDYVGHGLHYSLVRPVAGGEVNPGEPVEPPPVDTVEILDVDGNVSPGEQFTYAVRPVEGSTRIRITMLVEGEGNPNMFVSRNRVPSPVVFECGPQLGVNEEEVCEFDNVAPGDIFYVKIRGTSGRGYFYAGSSAE